MNHSSHTPYKLFFETLGNHTRWEIVHLIMYKQHRATAIAKALGYEQSLVSHHLRRLETCGFVTVSMKGKERIYKLNSQTVKPLLRFMDKHIDKFCSKICQNC